MSAESLRASCCAPSYLLPPDPVLHPETFPAGGDEHFYHGGPFPLFVSKNSLAKRERKKKKPQKPPFNFM